MPLQFEAFDTESGAFTYPDNCYNGLLAEFDDLLDAHGSGELNHTRYLAALNRLLAEAPDFIDGHAHIVSHWYRQGKPKKALDASLLGHKYAVTITEVGVRLLLGSEALRAGDFDHANAVFEAEADCYPPYYHELSLTHILRDEWTPGAHGLPMLEINPARMGAVFARTI
jgi:hypothetical protein